MFLVVLACGWTGDGLRPGSAYRPRIESDYLNIPTSAYVNRTGNPPTAPAMVVVKVDGQTLDRLRFDNLYTIHSVTEILN
jgi:hypothetical protein